LIEARDEKRLLRFQKQIAAYELLIIDELGYVPLSKTGAELLFETISQRYERNSTLITAIYPSMNGLRSSAPSGSPAPCWTGSPTTSTSWR
jgi:DNA replication protein DnaC